MADPRPIFDFTGSERFMREALVFAQRLENDSTTRGAVRDTSLDAWLGPHGDTFRSARDQENADKDTVIRMIEESIMYWMHLWQTAASQTRRAIYTEAMDAQQAHNDNLRSWYDSLKFWEWGGDESYGQVEAPSDAYDGTLVEAPQPGGFMPPAVFPVYSLSGDSYTISHYVNDVGSAGVR